MLEGAARLCCFSAQFTIAFGNPTVLGTSLWAVSAGCSGSGVQWKWGAVEAGCSSSRAHAGEGVCVHGGMSCCGTWGLGKRLLKVGEKREVGKARSGLGLAELKRAHFPEELVSSTDRITRWVSPSVKRGLRGGRLQKKKGGL